MKREITIKNDKIRYTLRKSKRAKYVRLSVGCDANVCVTIPWRANEVLATDFLQKKSDWLLKKINYFKNEGRSAIPAPNREDYLRYKALALKVVEEKIARFNSYYGFPFKKVAIRNQKTRWASCSSNGNLNFSYRIVFLPDQLSDYVVAHELCHLKHFNHGKEFWELVGRTIPDFEEVRKKVRSM